MRKIRINPRHHSCKIPPTDADNLRFDDLRRLKNALFALQQLDPGWMYWLERNISKALPLPQVRIRVERRARLLVANRYQFLGRAVWLGTVYGDYYFTGGSNLRMTL